MLIGGLGGGLGRVGSGGVGVIGGGGMELLSGCIGLMRSVIGGGGSGGRGGFSGVLLVC